VAGTGAAAAEFVARAQRTGARPLLRQPALTLFELTDVQAAPMRACSHLFVREYGCIVSGEIHTVLPVSCADAAVQVAAAYAAEGVRAWAELDGLFAVALWDAVRGELLLYRDPGGGAGLFHARLDAGTLVFASRLSSLLELLPQRPALSQPALHEYLRFLDVSPPHTIFAGVQALEPGVLMRWRTGAVETCETLPAMPPSAPRPRTLAAAADELDLRLGRAVAARLPAGQGCTVFLSGGVDSALLCALASEQAGNRCEALTVGFDEAENDESGAAAQVAAHLGLAHRVLRFSLDDYHAAFASWLATLDFPYADPAGLPTFLAYREVRRQHEVALDGTGADSLLGIMPTRHLRLATQYAARIPVPLRARFARWLGAPGPLAAVRHALHPVFDFDQAEELLIRWRGWTRQDLEVLLQEPVSLAHTRFYRVYRSFPAAAHFERYSALIGALPDDRVHQSAARTGLRVRLPFLAPQVQDYVRALPVGYRHQPDEPKRLLRTLLARRVPAALWERPKHGFDFPLSAFLRHDGHALVRQCMQRVAADDRFEAAVVQRLGRDFIAGDPRPMFRIWALIVLLGWQDACAARLAHDAVGRGASL
jgi:asparagine synthase (glutamine-hydrolysing)